MIDVAMSALQSTLQIFINDAIGSLQHQVRLDNIALVESPDSADELKDKVIISLVNIEEESALKNGVHYKTNPANGFVRYENPPVYLNLYLLFTVNFPRQYSDALKLLSIIVQCFQGKNQFQVNDEILLSLDLYTMTFEQINHLWGSLGGKQVPFVMYKARLVKITDKRTIGSGKLIEEVQGTENIK